MNGRKEKNVINLVMSKPISPSLQTEEQNKSPDLVDRLDELEVLVKKNIQWNEIVFNEVKRVRRQLTWMNIGGYIRLLFWLTPVILGAIFLPPLYRQLKAGYQSIVQPGKSLEVRFNGLVDSFKKSTATSTRSYD